MKHQDKRHIIVASVMVACLVAGLAINLLLLIRHFSGAGIAGCGGGSGCAELLQSRWSQVWGIPVTSFGVLAYLGLCLSFMPKARPLQCPLLGLIAGAAVWFIFVQAVLLGRFCPWCMAAHGIGISISILFLWRHSLDGPALPAAKIIALSASLAAPCIALLQVLGPMPVTHRIGALASPAVDLSVGIHARGSGRKVVFDGGGKTYDLSTMPRLGREDARCVMVEYFDYSCAACRTMSGYIDALMARHPDDLSVLLLPVPMERACNHSMPAGESDHPGSCEMARHALAVWWIKPDLFAACHRAMLESPAPADPRSLALRFITSAELDAALRDPWIAAIIQANLRDWVAFSADTRNLPKLLITGKRILHGLPSGEADFIRVMERELGF